MLPSELPALAVLFLSAFAAASLLPLASEPLLVGLEVSGAHSTLSLWLVASVGNIAGSVVNWWLGRFALYWQDKPWFPVVPRQLNRAEGWFQRYGVWALLMAWMPVVGDALTCVAGLLGVRLGVFLVLVGVGKAARYAALLWLVQPF
jgi:membrane protein YqaA with SNARE-associated domain